MSLTFNLVVACNNLNALRQFAVFLTNYTLHEKPSFVEKALISVARKWIEHKSIYFFKEIRKEVYLVPFEFPKEGQSHLLAAITIGMRPQSGVPKNTKELFDGLAALALEYDKLKMPRAEVLNGSQSL